VKLDYLVKSYSVLKMIKNKKRRNSIHFEILLQKREECDSGC